MRTIASRLSRLNQGGDTIVEVLMAIAIVSLVLGGAYVTTNKSLRATRDAQEHTNALKLIEGQVEQIKSVAASDPDALFATTGSFCINAGAITPASSNVCRLNSSGNPTTTPPIYNLSIVRSGNLFTASVAWDSVMGTGTAREQMVYRIYR